MSDPAKAYTDLVMLIGERNTHRDRLKEVNARIAIATLTAYDAGIKTSDLQRMLGLSNQRIHQMMNEARSAKFISDQLTS